MSRAQADRYVSRVGPGEGAAGLGRVPGPRPGHREGLTVLLVSDVSCSFSPTG